MNNGEAGVAEEERALGVAAMDKFDDARAGTADTPLPGGSAGQPGAGAWAPAAVVIAAGGAGRRMGGVRKQYLELLGEPVLVHALRPFLAHPAIGWAVVALPEEDLADPPAWLPGLDPRIILVAGGAERGDSVRLALEAVPEEAELVLVHDAARPLVERAVIDRALTAALAGVGAVAAVPLADTLKEVDAEGRITGTPDRSRFWRAQTPQAFPRRILLDTARRALADGYEATDDAALVEHYGGTVIVVEGSPANLKVTTPADIVVAESLLREQISSSAQGGVGAGGTGGQDRAGATAEPRVEREAGGVEVRRETGGAPVVIPFRNAADREREAPRVVAHLRAGGLIAYPTETVYGLGCALQPAALERLASLKGRDRAEPFLLLVERPEAVRGVLWTESALRLAAAFWPGPLTLALRAEADHFPERVLSAGRTVAVRSSPHPAVNSILAALGQPVTSTSANRSGGAPAMSATGVVALMAELGEPADLWILDGGPLPPSAPSTIVDCTGPRPRLLREGAIPVTALAGVVGYLDSEPAVNGAAGEFALDAAEDRGPHRGQEPEGEVPPDPKVN
jgi:2-C-methyl-D-erythritol 4-phosphate cytidylyltransferase